MDSKSRIVNSRLNEKIKCVVYPGHFATNHSHVNYYFDLTEVKVQHKLARLAAIELARRYRSVRVDTVICLEGTEMIGAYIADELSETKQAFVNTGKSIHVLAPELNSSNQMIFRENTQMMVCGKNILLMVCTASTGKTIGRALDCLQYYSGYLAGICTLFSAVDEFGGHAIHSVFTADDLPGYQSYIPGQCRMCEGREKIDAIANSFGYSRLY